jgi:hypothetical protein
MARIRSRGNRDTELALARLLRVHGITGWRRHTRLKVTRDMDRGRAGGIRSGGIRGAAGCCGAQAGVCCACGNTN